MEEIKLDIRRSINNPSFWISIIITLLVIALGIGSKMLFPEGATEGLSPYYHAEILFKALSSDIVLMVVPILCTLPYTTAFLEEHTSGYIKTYIMKCNKESYIRGKVIAPAISGGLCLALGILIAYFIGYLVYAPLELVDETAISPFIEVLKTSMLFFTSGCLWASIGALFANISLSKYMAYASPFVFFYVLVILAERYFQKLYIINPKEWLILQNYWPMEEWGAILLMGILTVIICMINDNVIEKRINNE
ncbi:MAG: hypothetical protein ACOWWH_05995 [Eubacteriaceae bacterium]